MTELIIANNDMKKEINQLKAEFLDSIRSNSGSEHTGKYKLSTKLLDPDRLDDSKSPKFKDQLSRIKKKLNYNTDYYLTKAFKLVYVEGRTTKKAVIYIQRRL